MQHRIKKMRQAEALKNLLETNPAQRRRLRRLVYRCPNDKGCSLLEIYVSPHGVYAYQLGSRMSLDHLETKLELGGIDPADYSHLSDADKKAYFSGSGFEAVKSDAEPVSQFDFFRLFCRHVDYVDVTHERIRRDLNAGRKTVRIAITQ